LAIQEAIPDIKKDLDGGELSDIQLVERIIRLKAERIQVTDELKASTKDLAERLIKRGVTEATIGDKLVVVNPKLLTEYDQTTLLSLKQCVTDDHLWLTVRQLPSGKQLKALSDLSGAAAKAVIASAKRKIDTGVQTVRIKKPRQPKGRRRARF